MLAEQDDIASDLDRLAARRAAFVYGVSAFPQEEEDASFFGRMAIFTRLREARLRDAPIGLPRVPASGPATARSQTGGSQTGGRQTARGYATDQATACPRSTASSGVEGLGEEDEEEEGDEWLSSSSYDMSSSEERRKSRAREEERERVSRLAEE